VACPKCGSDKEKRDQTDTPLFGGDGFSNEVAYGEVTCAECGTALGEAGMREIELARAHLLFRLGVGTGKAFRHIRHALKFQSRHLASLLQVRPETVSHWESRDGLVDRSAWLALGALLEDCLACRTTMRERLLAALSPQIPDAPINLDAPLGRNERVFPGEDLPDLPEPTASRGRPDGRRREKKSSFLATKKGRRRGAPPSGRGPGRRK
jgi:hypothetical protein